MRLSAKTASKAGQDAVCLFLLTDWALQSAGRKAEWVLYAVF